MQAEIWGCLHKFLGAPFLKKLVKTSFMQRGKFDIIHGMARSCQFSAVLIGAILTCLGAHEKRGKTRA